MANGRPFQRSYTGTNSWTKSVLQARGLAETIGAHGLLSSFHPDRGGHFVKARGRVREYWDGSLALFDGPRKIAASAADAALEQEQAKEKSAKQKSAKGKSAA